MTLSESTAVQVCFVAESESIGSKRKILHYHDLAGGGRRGNHTTEYSQKTPPGPGSFPELGTLAVAVPAANSKAVPAH